ncbi:hypothetical protein JNUCC83_04720 [Vagococcus sp. JNUCC 83]
MRKSIKERITECETIENLLQISKIYYLNIPIDKRSIIFNQLIFQKKMNSEDVYLSLKLTTNLALLFMAYSFKKKKFTFFLHNKGLSDEILVFRMFVMKFHELYINQQTQQMLDSDGKFFSTFLNFHFHYPSISAGDYLEMFSIFEELSKKIYGFSIYDISKLLLFFTSDTRQNSNGEIVDLTNDWVDREQMNNIFSGNPPIEILSGLFIDSSEINPDKVYPTDIPKIFKGKIGIAFENGYFIPQSQFIFENILRHLIENEKSNNVKGDILEDHLEEILADFFGEESVFKKYFDDQGNEQDIFVRCGDIVLAVECKAQDFKEVYRNKEKAVNRLNRHFNKIIKHACKQCDRVKKNIVNNKSVIYYDSEDKKSRKKKIDIPDTSKIRVLKVVVTLDDYLNLSESPQEFLDTEYKDTWIVNIFNLKRILWISQKEQFIEYIQYRTSLIETISSLNADELEQYGYFISPNFRFYPQNDIGISISLRSGFSKVFDLYDDYSNNKEIKKLDNYLHNLISKNL